MLELAAHVHTLSFLNLTVYDSDACTAKPLRGLLYTGQNDYQLARRNGLQKRGNGILAVFVESL
jgi:hypothetical protein